MYGGERGLLLAEITGKKRSKNQKISFDVKNRWFTDRRIFGRCLVSKTVRLSGSEGGRDGAMGRNKGVVLLQTVRLWSVLTTFRLSFDGNGLVACRLQTAVRMVDIAWSEAMGWLQSRQGVGVLVWTVCLSGGKTVVLVRLSLGWKRLEGCCWSGRRATTILFLTLEVANSRG